ncbi:hypothetical protein H0H81_001843 [Sphagnurus paluster]|uniref:C2H2-type domain-containing protein n=1 Tax=Sphagnurus paluster TaxID=117069 RepID=A0A9P7K2T2_9AGAR|nr:hypothetical protein H0H81_001843 [Sphagnurus paluster]
MSSHHYPSLSDLDRDLNTVSSIERAYCANFSCCGISLPDLHALFEHFESPAHVHLHALSLKPLSTYILPAPTPAPSALPATPATATPTPVHTLWAVPAQPPPPAVSVYQADAYALAEYPTYEQCFRAAASSVNSSASSSSSSSSSSNSSSSSSTSTSTSSSSSPEPESSPSPAPAPVPGSGPGAPQSLSTLFADSIMPLLCSPLSSAPSSPPYDVSPPPYTAQDQDQYAYQDGYHQGHTAPRRAGAGCARRRGKVDLAGVPLAARRRSKRMHPCPTPGCVKTYLNPNGLKYHREKGTCSIEVVVAAARAEPGIEERRVAVHHPQPARACVPEALVQWDGVAEAA